MRGELRLFERQGGGGEGGISRASIFWRGNDLLRKPTGVIIYAAARELGARLCNWGGGGVPGMGDAESCGYW